MIDLIISERHRILNKRMKLGIVILILGLSAYIGLSCKNEYAQYSSNGTLQLSAGENLSESQKRENDCELDENTIIDTVNQTEKTNYCYYRNRIRLLLNNYEDLSMSDITKADAANYEERRIENINTNLQACDAFNQSQIDWLLLNARNNNKSTVTGYAEGWKNVAANLPFVLEVVMIMLSVILLFVFGENPKYSMDSYGVATKYGYKKWKKAKLIAALQVGTIVYLLSVGIYSIVMFSIFGLHGAGFMIQSDTLYLFSTININFMQQYLANISVGFLAVILHSGIVLLLTSFTRQILSSGVFVFFYWILMYTLPCNFYTSFGVSHYFTNFLPYNAIDLSRSYITNEIYTICGKYIYGAMWVPLVMLLMIIMCILGTYILNCRNCK